MAVVQQAAVAHRQAGWCGPINAAGQRDGRGKYLYPNSFFRYEGEMSNGKKNGFGRLTMGDGWSYYEGQWLNDEMQGKGTRVFANGNKYTGDFLKGEMHGIGTLELANRGGTYQGSFHRNKYQGAGVLRLPGGLYEGQFADHKSEGHGHFVAANGDAYVGAWVAGKRCGQGVCRYANGDVYAGSWLDDQPSGPGTLAVARPPFTYKGLFIDGKPEVVPTKLNAYFTVPESASPPGTATPRQRGSSGGRDKAPAAAKAAGSAGTTGKTGVKEEAAAVAAATAAAQAAGADADSGQQAGFVQVEPAGPLQLVVGQALVHELVFAAQCEASAADWRPASSACRTAAAAAAGAGAGAATPAAAGESAAAGSSGEGIPVAPAAETMQQQAPAAAPAAPGRQGSPPKTAQRRPGQSTRASSSSGGSAPEPPLCTGAPEAAAAPRTMHFELPTPAADGGRRVWRTAEGEEGRRVLVTLQRRAPQQLAAGRCLSVLLCCMRDEADRREGGEAVGQGGAGQGGAAEAVGGSGAIAVQGGGAGQDDALGGVVAGSGEAAAGAQKSDAAGVRVVLHICLNAQMSEPLPLDTASPSSPERVTGLSFALSGGSHTLRGLTLGRSCPSCIPTGSNFLVMTSPGVRPGVVPVVVGPVAPEAPAAGKGRGSTGS